MGRFDALKTTIDANIRENGNQEITGEILNLVLNEMVSVVDDEKQDLLMDGVNIKTINGQKILGRGNITIEGGGGGGITEEKEVYIGEEEPTDDGAKLWIDPTGTPSQPSQPSQPGGESSRGRAYFLPIGCAAETYTFSTTEAQKFKDALSQADTTYHFGFFENGLGIYFPLQMERFSEKRVYLRGSQVVANADAFGMAVWVFIVVFDEESVVCTFEQFSKNIE